MLLMSVAAVTAIARVSVNGLCSSRAIAESDANGTDGGHRLAAHPALTQRKAKVVTVVVRRW